MGDRFAGVSPSPLVNRPPNDLPPNCVGGRSCVCGFAGFLFLLRGGRSLDVLVGVFPTVEVSCVCSRCLFCRGCRCAGFLGGCCGWCATCASELTGKVALEASFVPSRAWPRPWPRPRPREPRPGPPRPRSRNRECPLLLFSELATTGGTTAVSAALMLVSELLVKGSLGDVVVFVVDGLLDI